MWGVPAGFFTSKKQLSIIFDVFSLLFDDLEEGDDDDDNDDNNDDDTETPDPVQAQIPSHPGIKYPVRGIPPSDDLLTPKNPDQRNIEFYTVF